MSITQSLRKESVRAYVYRVGVALSGVAVAYGVLAESKASALVGLLATVTNLLATANTSRAAD